MYTVFCPYCGNKAKIVDGTSIYPHREDLSHKVFYKCNPCDAFVGVHADSGNVPLGTLANSELRKARNLAHSSFDPIWRDGLLSRGEAYKWLAKELNIKQSDCHIAMFEIETCRKVQVLSTQKYWNF